MILYVKNKWVSIRDGSFAVDENGVEHFKVDGKLFSPTKKKFVKDLAGNTLYIVRNKYWHGFCRSAFIYDGKTGKKIAKIKEKFLSPKMRVTHCEDEIIMESNGLFKGFSIVKNGKTISSWSRSGGNGMTDIFRDCFRLEVYEEEEAAFMVAFTIAVDNIDDKGKRD